MNALSFIVVILLSAVVGMQIHAIGWIIAFTFLACRSYAHREPFLVIFGLLIPLLPAFGSGTLLFVSIAAIGAYSGRSLLLTRGLLIPYVLLLFTSTLFRAASEIDFGSLMLLFHQPFNGGIQSFSSFLAAFAELRYALVLTPPWWMVMAEATLRLLVLILALDLFVCDKRAKDRVLRGIIVGVFIASGVSVLQHLTSFDGRYPNYHPFWEMVGRLPGTFTDPNAYGVFIALTLPFFFSRNDAALRVAGSSAAAIALFSGSRSLVLALGLYVVLFAVRHSAKGTCTTLATGAASFIGLQFISLAYLSPLLPVGLERVLASLQSQSWMTAFESRRIFWEAAFRMWYEFPISGIGYMNFREELPAYLLRMRQDLRGWIDNSNSFYLSILAETGLWGAFLGVVSLRGLRRKSCSSTALSGTALSSTAHSDVKVPFQSFIPQFESRQKEQETFTYCAAHDATAHLYAGIGLVVLLLVGPHLDFDEVSLLAALIGSFWCIPLRNFTLPFPLAPLLGGTLLILTVQWYYRDRGFFGWEFDGARWYRWTGSTARGSLFCPATGEGTLTVRAFKSNLVTLSVGETSYLLAPSKSDHHVSFACFPAERVVYQLSVPKTWVPKLVLGGNDSRQLGVQVVDSPVPHPFLRWR